MEQAPDLRLKLIGGWDLSKNGRSLSVGLRQQRLIAALAIHGQRPRSFLGGLLWPQDTETHAMGSLRAAVFTIARRMPGVLSCTGHDLRLGDGMDVDLHKLRAAITAHQPSPGPWFTGYTNAQLLPGWYDDWVVTEQERLRADYTDAVERLAGAALTEHDHYQALHLARLVVDGDPLRESAARILVQTHLEMGNHATALQIMHRYTDFLKQELGITPSSRFLELLDAGPVASTPVGSER
ncbi:AfsR/SARP family transcriptional regulator [Kocuria sp. LHG3120]|uniref:AfsR/SARP family transcriptional regulator n=1 Tax=Kocuria sp. LHG3120 TaxID=2804590 RepID=UPI003CF40052